MKRIFSLLLLCVVVPLLISCSSVKEHAGTLTPKNLSLAGWYVTGNYARSEANFEAIADKYDGKYVTLKDCKVTYVGSENITVTDIYDPQTVKICFAKSEVDELIDLNVGDIVVVTGKVKAKSGLFGHSIELKDAVFGEAN